MRKPGLTDPPAMSRSCQQVPSWAGEPNGISSCTWHGLPSRPAAQPRCARLHACVKLTFIPGVTYRRGPDLPAQVSWTTLLMDQHQVRGDTRCIADAGAQHSHSQLPSTVHEAYITLNTPRDAFSHLSGGVSPRRQIQTRRGWGWERGRQGRRGKSWKWWSQQETQIRAKPWKLPTCDLLCEEHLLSALPTRAFSLASNTPTFFLPVLSLPA